MEEKKSGIVAMTMMFVIMMILGSRSVLAEQGDEVLNTLEKAVVNAMNKYKEHISLAQNRCNENPTRQNHDRHLYVIKAMQEAISLAPTEKERYMGTKLLAEGLSAGDRYDEIEDLKNRGKNLDSKDDVENALREAVTNYKAYTFINRPDEPFSEILRDLEKFIATNWGKI